MADIVGEPGEKVGNDPGLGSMGRVVGSEEGVEGRWVYVALDTATDLAC